MELKNQVLEKKKNKNKSIETDIALVLSMISVISLFFPYVRYTIKGYIYEVNAFDLISAKGLRLENNLILIPLITKISLILSTILPIIAIMLLFMNKAKIAAFFYSLSSLTSIIVLLSTTVMQTDLAYLGITNVTIQYLIPFMLVILLGLACAILSLLTKGIELLAESIFLVFSCVSIGSVIIITLYMILSGIPAISKIGLFDFLFTSVWKPSQDKYGILAIILSSILGTFGAIVIGVPIGILTAVFLSETAPKKLANIVRPAVQLLAGIPSVVYGFFGMLIIVPIIRNIFPDKTIGDSLLAVIIVLSIMVLPTIVSTAETSLRSVPKSYREAALALGTTPVRTIFKITIPAARSGILSGVILGVGRAIGETMAVIMVAGNVVNMPSILGSVRLLTTGIVLEMSYSSGLHRQALFAIGLILFIFIMIVNLSFIAISKRGVQMNEK